MQEDVTFAQCVQLVKALWNQEFASAWPLLRGMSWPEPLQAMRPHLERAVRRHASDFVARAYAVVTVVHAARALGLDEAEVPSGALAVLLFLL